MGHGSRNLLCFHGFGQTAKVFNFLENEYSESYTIYSFDFLFHGESVLIDDNQNNKIDKENWVKLIANFLNENKIEQIDLLGYSMGGRLSLALVEILPERINKVFLFATDGIWNSFWFNFSTRNWLGKYLFKRFTFKPTPFFRILNLLVSIKIIPAKLKQIANINTSSEEKRIQVFNTWSCLTLIRIDLKLVERNISHYNIDLEISTGKYDQIIPLKLSAALQTT